MILGLLSDGSKSGYAIKQEIEQVISHFWKESFGQIYPALHQLCQDGLARRNAGRTGHRQRHLYTITPAGRRELRRWLVIPPGVGIIRHELLLKVFFGKHTDPATLLRHLETYRERVEQTQTFLLEAEKDIRATIPAGEQDYWLLTVRSGQLVTEAGLAWAAEARRVLGRMKRGSEILSSLKSKRRQT